jgi:hypothetical protein
VPTRQPLCHCGFEQAKAAAAPKPPQPEEEPARRRGLFLAALLVLAGGLTIYSWTAPGSALPQERAIGAEPGAHREAGYAPLPNLPAQEGPPPMPSSPAPAVVSVSNAWSALAVGGPATPQPSANAATPPPVPSPVATTAPAAAPVATPAPTSMEDALARAIELLEPPLRQMEAESKALETEYRSFATVCAPAGSAAAGPWLVGLKAASRTIDREPSGIPVNDKGPIVDCPSLVKDLTSRAGALKTGLASAEDRARASGVLPGHWRVLVARHGLEGWESY